MGIEIEQQFFRFTSGVQEYITNTPVLVIQARRPL